MKRRFTEEQLREKISKAPLWMQDVTNQALAERDEAKAELARKYESQTPTPVYIEKFSPEGTTKTYIETDHVTIEYAGIQLHIDLNEYGNRDGKGIELRYGTPPFLSGSEVAIVPKHSGCIELRLPENMLRKIPRKKKRARRK